jgi:hypothetical protein
MEEFTLFEIQFLNAAAELPEEYVDYIAPPLDDGLVIPCKEPKVGDLKIWVFRDFIHIRVGDHTDIRTSNPKQAVEYLNDILTDQLVFCFHEGQVDHFRANEFENTNEFDWNYYVWSGPFRQVFIEKRLRGKYS